MGRRNESLLDWPHKPKASPKTSPTTGPPYGRYLKRALADTLLGPALQQLRDNPELYATANGAAMAKVPPVAPPKPRDQEWPSGNRRKKAPSIDAVDTLPAYYDASEPVSGQDT